MFLPGLDGKALLQLFKLGLLVVQGDLGVLGNVLSVLLVIPLQGQDDLAVTGLDDRPDDYVHRVGRTARAEAEGDAFVLVSPAEERDSIRPPVNQFVLRRDSDHLAADTIRVRRNDLL
jgi:hypothetical protein